jgi:hypothetical protein
MARTGAEEQRPTSTVPHEHEKWQVRESPDGGRYCAACGGRVAEGKLTR